MRLGNFELWKFWFFFKFWILKILNYENFEFWSFWILEIWIYEQFLLLCITVGGKPKLPLGKGASNALEPGNDGKTEKAFSRAVLQRFTSTLLQISLIWKNWLIWQHRPPSFSPHINFWKNLFFIHHLESRTREWCAKPWFLSNFSFSFLGWKSFSNED